MDRKRKDVGGKFSIQGKTYTIYGGVNPIGRNREAVVNIKNLGVSQQHALFILVDDDLHFISDLNSSNGTFLKNRKLEPLRLYRLENGSHIKFGEVEGTYTKYTLQDVERLEDISCLSENTQNYTQNFYGSNTQIIDNTDTTIKQLDNKSLEGNYIPSQVLAEMADKLEDSYTAETQVVNSENIEKNENDISAPLMDKESNTNNCEESNVDMHEAQTQVIVTEPDNLEENNDCEAETQVIENHSMVETSLKSIIDLHELETQEINIYPEVEEEFSLEDIDKELHESNEQISSVQIENPTNGSSDQITKEDSLPPDSNLKTSVHISQDNDVVNPVGLTNNVLNDSQEDSDTDIIRPVKKSINIFESQDPTIEDIREDAEKSEIDGDSKSLDDSESDIIRPLKKSVNIFESQESEGMDEESNDSVDFLTMQKIPSTQKYLNSEENSPNTKLKNSEQSSENNRSIVKNDDTNINDNKSLHLDDGSETEDEIEIKISRNKEKSEVENNEHTYASKNLGKSQNSDSETDIEENNSVSKSDENKKTKTEKDENIFYSGADDDRLKNPEVSTKIPTLDSDSETDLEDNLNPVKDIKNNESIGLVLDESALEEIPENSEKPNTGNPPRLSVPCNVSLNESDYIPSTQEEHAKSSSQNSRLENSENSFKLGLTQLMEEDNVSQTNKEGDSQGNSDSGIENSKSQSSQDKKKFTFKKSSLGATESVDITLDYDGDIYQANTQNICGGSSNINDSLDDHVFLQPTQEAPKRSKHNKNESIPDEDIYLLSTQQLDGSPTKNAPNTSIPDDEIYILSTQQLDVSPSKDAEKILANKDKATRLSENEFYQLPTQKITKTEEKVEIHSNSDKNDDDDIFATQPMDVNESPTKCLESELETMFATQRAIPADDTLDKIQDIVRNNGITDDKLPCEDKDLEAILATQKMLDSPKRTKKTPEKSVESQLEVIFASQPCNLPPDKFVRPPNPLVNIFDAQNTQELPKEEHSSSDKDKKTSEDEDSFGKTRKPCRVGLEQSFALLEANSTKIRRSRRTKDCEEITVSCPKSRVSMVVAPNDKAMSEEEPKPIKTARSSRKRQPPAALENFVMDVKEHRRSKRRRLSENSNSSDEESEPIVSSRSSKQNTRNKLLRKIQEDDDDPKISERPRTPSKKRSSRLQKQKVEENEVKDIKNTYQSRTSKATDPCASYDNSKENEVLENHVNKSSEDIKDPKTKSTKVKGRTDEEDDTKSEKKVTKTNKTRKSRKNEIEKEESSTSTSNTAVASMKQSRKFKEDSKESFENEKEDKKLVTASTRKLKDDIETPKTPSRASKRGCKIEVTTPPKIKKESEATPSCSTRKRPVLDVQDTPNRAKRKLKPKVVFTMMENPRLEAQIKQLGGSVVDSIETGTVLLTKFVKRSMKLLSAVGLGKPICSEEWVLQSKKESNFLDPWDFILVDKEAEEKWDFSLKTSLERSLQAKLFEGCTFQLLVTNAVDVLKGAIESCGGKIVTRTPKGANNFIVVASADQKDKYKRLLKQQPDLIIVEPEAIFDGVLRQEIRFERHLLN
ncbi:putative leucine-rich repeat-containing protein DDB_G0290503 [Coccinella septempunctata]|uniref:putative leucine-rich repeat-containing protein DDB_G0290503 n=1 Tax=Coccinella septempunctata TaxID=41139 RepID=UPI001D066377|nr:putative leucine-rich repeat-containing protein DDB_G0290503 [Coccinella septempunctata]